MMKDNHGHPQKDKNSSKNNKLNDKYSELLDTLIKNSRSDQHLKCAFLWIIGLVFILVCIFTFIILLNIVRKDSVSFTDLGSIGLEFGSVVAIINNIAKYFFDNKK